MKKHSIIVTVCILAGTGLFLTPFVFYGPHPLGYDTGFYRRYLTQPFLSLPNTAVPGLGKDALGPRIMLDILRLTHLPIDSMLYGSYIFLFAMQALALFFLTKHYWGAHVGWLAALLLNISPIQYTAFWYMLFKNAFALPLMLFSFLLLEKQSRWAIPIGMLITASHHTTGIIFLGTLGIHTIINKENRRVVLETLTAALSVFFFFHISSIQDYIKSPVAVFVTTHEYIALSLPLFGFALYGIKKMISDQKRTILVSFAIAGAAFPIFSLPFYERIFIFTNIAVVVAAAIGLHRTYIEIKNAKKATTKYVLIFFVLIFAGWIVTTTYSRIQNLRPLISPQELRELESISFYTPASAVILTSTVLAPWVHGWSQQKVIAPGLLYDTRSIQEWVSFSDGLREDKITFLKGIPKPLYIFLSSPEKEKFLTHINECFQEKTSYLFQYICRPFAQ